MKKTLNALNLYIIKNNLYLKTMYPLLLFIIVSLYYAPIIINKDLGGDISTGYVVHYSFVFSSIKSGELPFWFPYTSLGLPEMTKGMALFNPFIILIFLADFLLNPQNSLSVLGNILEVSWVLNSFFGSLGFYLLCKNYLKINNTASLLGSLVFILNPFSFGHFFAHVTLCYSLIPWFTYFLLKFLENSNFKNFLIITIINYFIFTTSYPYVYIYFFLLELILVLYLNYKKLHLYLFSFFISFLLAGFFLLPTLHHYLNSSRGSSLPDVYHFNASNLPTRIVNIFNPMPYDTFTNSPLDHYRYYSQGVSWGIFSLIFLFIGFASFKKNKFSIWLTGVFVLFLVYSLGGYLLSHSFFGQIVLLIGLLRTHYQGLMLVAFAGSIFITWGMNASLNGHRKKWIEIGYGLLILFFLIILFIISIINSSKSTLISTSFDQLLSLSRFIIIGGISLLICYLTTKFKSVGFLVIGAIVMIAEFRFYALNYGLFEEVTYSQKFSRNSLIPNDNSSELFRVEFFENQFHCGAWMHKIYTLTSCDEVPLKGLSKLNSKYSGLDLLKLSNVKYFVTTEKNWNNDKKDVILIKDTGPVEKPEEVFFSSTEAKPLTYSILSKKTHYIYEIKNIQPRFFTPNTVKKCKNNNCMEVEKLPKTVSLIDIDQDFENPKSEDVKISVQSFKSSEIKLKVNSPSKAFVVASEMWDKGWNIKVNENPDRVYKVGEYFRGFFVPSGDSIVVMSYYPPLLNEGIILTIISIVLLFIVHINFDQIRNFNLKGFIDKYKTH